LGGYKTNVPLLKSEWVGLRDPAASRGRTHGGTGAGTLALVKPGLGTGARDTALAEARLELAH